MTTEQKLWLSLKRQVRRTYGPNRRHMIAWQSPLWWKLYALFTFHPYISKVPRPRRRIR